MSFRVSPLTLTLKRRRGFWHELAVKFEGVQTPTQIAHKQDFINNIHLTWGPERMKLNRDLPRTGGEGTWSPCVRKGALPIIRGT